MFRHPIQDVSPSSSSSPPLLPSSSARPSLDKKRRDSTQLFMDYMSTRPADSHALAERLGALQERVLAGDLDPDVLRELADIKEAIRASGLDEQASGRAGGGRPPLRFRSSRSRSRVRVRVRVRLGFGFGFGFVRLGCISVSFLTPAQHPRPRSAFGVVACPTGHGSSGVSLLGCEDEPRGVAPLCVRVLGVVPV